MNKWIVFDVDDVVASYRESLYQSFKTLGKDIHWSKWNTYKHVKIYGLNRAYRVVAHTSISRALRPIKLAAIAANGGNADSFSSL
jgi:hypothetical protein